MFITTNWVNAAQTAIAEDEVLFTLLVDAKTDAQLSDLIHVSSRYTKAEAYSANDEFLNVNFRFDNNETNNVATFNLYQNQPNPFKESTVIGFQLPKAGTATLTIFDISGQVVFQQDGNFAKGYNEIQLDQSILGSGTLYYQLMTDQNTATKKMTIIK